MNFPVKKFRKLSDQQLSALVSSAAVGQTFDNNSYVFNNIAKSNNAFLYEHYNELFNGGVWKECINSIDDFVAHLEKVGLA